MAKITWLGEDELHGPDQTGPSSTTWNNIRFDKGKPVEVTDLDMIVNAKGNKFFKVEGGPGRPPGSSKKAGEADDDENTQ